MKVESFDKTVERLLHESYFRIPRYQRRYGWTRSNNEEFWADVVDESERDYFIGSMIVFPSGRGTVDVVDGQQRLTTITVLLAALRDAMSAEGLTDLATGLHRFIERPNVDNKMSFVLLSESSSPFLQERIQSAEEPEADLPAPTEEEQDLAAALVFFQDKLSTEIALMRNDEALSTKAQAERVRERLLEIRDKILGLQVILVHVDSEDHAYIIFETLNSRGLDLTVADLLKNHLLRGLKARNADVDIPRDRFNGIHEQFNDSEQNIDINRFIHHDWLTRAPYVSMKKLFPSIKKAISTPADKKQLLDLLVEDAALYRAIHEPASYKWTAHQRSIASSLQALADFRVTQPMPLTLAVLRALLIDKSIRLPLAKRTLRAVECFHFMTTAVSGRSSSGGISQMYAAHARSLLDAGTSQARADGLRDLAGKLRDRLPEREEFVQDFIQLRYSQDHTQQKKLVQYVLRSHYSHEVSGAAPDFESMTIEHLAPQRPANGKPMDGYDRIGNLLLLDQVSNDRLANLPFTKKQPELGVIAQGQVWIDPWILQQKSWSRERVHQRGVALAESAYDEIWRF